jgi:superfamily II DNA helicase RecQ
MQYRFIYYVDCCITRGKDFRTAFDRLGGIRAFIDVPFMALTASAPPEVEATIVSSLQLNNPVIVHCDLDRPNIYFSSSPIKTLNVSFNVKIEYHLCSIMTVERFRWFGEVSKDYITCKCA